MRVADLDSSLKKFGFEPNDLRQILLSDDANTVIRKEYAVLEMSVQARFRMLPPVIQWDAYTVIEEFTKKEETFFENVLAITKLTVKESLDEINKRIPTDFIKRFLGGLWIPKDIVKEICEDVCILLLATFLAKVANMFPEILDGDDLEIKDTVEKLANCSFEDILMMSEILEP